MKKFVYILIILTAFSACHKKAETPPPAAAQEAPKMPSKEEMLKKWTEYSTPGEEHKVLGRFVGKWNIKTTFWMDPNSPPEVTKGTSEIKWSMGGRFIEQNVKGVSMGQKFEGKGVVGYDKATKKYRSIWYDSMGTGLMIGSGLFDAAQQTLEEAGSASCPFKGTVAYRFNSIFKDKNHISSEMFMENPETGIDMKVMHIDYSRR